MFLAKSRPGLAIASAMAAALLPATGQAAGGHLEDAIADVLVWVVLVLVPVLAIWIFWKLHVLPEVIAEKRHHPQAEAIKSLCLLSLAFGGMLWPLRGCGRIRNRSVTGWPTAATSTMISTRRWAPRKT